MTATSAATANDASSGRTALKSFGGFNFGVTTGTTVTTTTSSMFTFTNATKAITTTTATG